MYRPSELKLTVTSYENGIKLTGILYFHRITDNSISQTVRHNLRIFGKICGGQMAANVILVTTMWDNEVFHQAERREQELLNKVWQPMIELGSRHVRFLQHGDSALDIVEQLINLDTRVTLFQEETVDLNRSIIETEAGKELYGQIQPLLSRKKAALVKLRQSTKKANDGAEMLALLQQEEAHVQAELDNFFAEARRLRSPLSQRMVLFLSLKPFAVCILLYSDGDLISDLNPLQRAIDF